MASTSTSLTTNSQKSSTLRLFRSSSFAVIAVFLITFCWLSFRLADVGFASGYIDRHSHIAAQDEALYTNSILTMARGGDWLTPKFLHRYGLYKPPLLYWLSAASVMLLGEGHFPVRLPSVLCGCFVACLVFAWARRSAGLIAGIGVTLLLIANPLFHTLGRLALTDMILLACIVSAMFVLYRDPQLTLVRSAVLCGVASGCALMTKGAAGLLPLMILGLYWLLVSPRPRFSRLLLAGVAALVVAMPWHIYQYSVHPRWFWAEYVLTEHLTFGFGSPPQTTHEAQALFYIRRLFLVDTPLVMFAAMSLWYWRERKTPERALLAAWILVICASVMAYQYRNVSYLLPMIPALCLAITGLPRRMALAVLAVGVSVMLIRPLYPDQPSGVNFRTGSTIPSAAVLERYAGMGRTNELIFVEPDDEFLSAVLPISHVRYVFVGPPEPPRRYALDFYELGIAMSAAEFNQFDVVRPKYAQRLREWGLEDERPLATAVLAADAKEIGAVIEAHPGSDFLLKGTPPTTGNHDVAAFPGGYVLLLAR